MVFMQPPWLFCLFSPRRSLVAGRWCPPASHPTLTFGTQAVSTRELPLLAFLAFDKKARSSSRPRARHPYIITRPPSFLSPQLTRPPFPSIYSSIPPTFPPRRPRGFFFQLVTHCTGFCRRGLCLLLGIPTTGHVTSLSRSPRPRTVLDKAKVDYLHGLPGIPRPSQLGHSHMSL
jgi:hypothetical protein